MMKLVALPSPLSPVLKGLPLPLIRPTEAAEEEEEEDDDDEEFPLVSSELVETTST